MLRALQDFADWLWNGEAYRRRAKVLRARQERERALKAYAAAKLVGDTRTVCATHKAYREATTACLRAEIAR